MDERESKLPAWAKELISELRLRMKVDKEQAVKEISVLRPENERLRTENAAMREFLLRAAAGGSVTAQAVMEVIQGYELQLVKKC